MKALDSVRKYFERNYVGFADKVTPVTKAAYQEHNRQAYAFAKRARSGADCYFVIDYWLGYFKDHHVSIKIPPPDSVETIKPGDQGLTQVTDTNAVEGIYYNMDSVYKIGVMKSKKGLRSYVGVILESRAPTWKPGQVKFELFDAGNNQYKGIWYLRNHSAYISTMQGELQKALTGEGWTKANAITGKEPVTFLFEEEKSVNTYFKKLNDSTGYLRIRTFDLFEAKHIDSVVRANLANIQSMPRLVIDLRNNGGGGDRSMSFLRPIIYTNPVKNIGVDLLLTPDNITAWEKAIDKYRAEISKKELDRMMQLLNIGRGKARTSVNFASDYTDTLLNVWPMPAKVAIVVNHGCGSTTEEFLLLARQSTKVVLAGEPSMGVLDYSNVVERDFYNPDFECYYSTTRSRRIDMGLGIDNVGIQPNIPLDLNNNNWLNELLVKL
ncbi:S41 family peptidase [Niastella yeongjuensis]|uniref:S41 family peptidase n=1 Tax=Niastella yeongjuensis TaxID=354355 RepID=UPI0013FD61CD|nr:S41 family peptidase [Niastella yeongjuensis]